MLITDAFTLVGILADALLITVFVALYRKINALHKDIKKQAIALSNAQLKDK